MITEQEVTEAEEEAVAAAVKADELQRRAGRRKWDDSVRAEILEAISRARYAAARAEGLRAQYGQQQDAIKARKAAEKAASAGIDEAAKALAASRDSTVAAIVAAERAMVEMVATLRAHDELVRRASAELAERGLTAVDGLGVEYETGSAANGGVRLRGEWWAPIEPGQAFMRSVHAVARARLGDQHTATRLVAFFGENHAAIKRADGVLERVPALAALDLPRPAVAHAAQLDRMPATGLPRRGDIDPRTGFLRSR